MSRTACLALLDSIVSPHHSVNLTAPDYAIIVEVIQGTCGVSVVPNFQAYPKKLHIPGDAPASDAAPAPLHTGAKMDTPACPTVNAPSCAGENANPDQTESAAGSESGAGQAAPGAAGVTKDAAV